MTRDADPQADSAPEPKEGSRAGDSPATPAPLLKIVSPNATPEEIAALVTVLAALGGEEPAPARRTTPEWQSPHRRVRRTFPHGPGGWRASGLPR
jgi:hypothetical protein